MSMRDILKEQNEDFKNLQVEILKEIDNCCERVNKHLVDAKIEGTKEGLGLESRSLNGAKCIPFKYWVNKCVFEYSWNSDYIKQDFLEKGYLIKNNKQYDVPKDSEYFIKDDGILFISLDLTLFYETMFVQQRTKKRKLVKKYNSMDKENKEETLYRISKQEAKERSALLEDVRDRKKLK